MWELKKMIVTDKIFTDPVGNLTTTTVACITKFMTLGMQVDFTDILHNAE